MKRIAIILFALLWRTGVAAADPAPAPVLDLDSRPIPLVGMLNAPAAWDTYKQRFVTERGRVIDTANGNISHSEGQGYGMLLAVAANDRDTFDRIWDWTRANLMVRNDELIAWRWEPGKKPAVADMNDASDGDLLVAWALTEAADAWPNPAYRVAGRRIAVEVGRKLVVWRTNWGPRLLPAVNGFAAEDRPDGPILNISYWVFPAFARLGLVAPELNWPALRQSGLDFVKVARFGTAGLPTDWVSMKGETLQPADNFKPVFGYNAVRIPFYLAWAGIGSREHYAPFRALWAHQDRSRLPVVDVSTNRSVEWLSEPGFAAIPRLVECATVGEKFGRDLMQLGPNENYYAASLHLLALTAVHMRYPACLAP